ncbi:GEVED domain-containing protein [uncultured Psychroserpens sp.]|uniref:GEVED domain-containing protein n=1 Tax=uncultured Psychroserpens sp. TaxID=255436 RepID=UPI00260B5DF4|nr:GEVED domain-containing protein [uncultured Psychroserpens sp.]
MNSQFRFLIAVLLMAIQANAQTPGVSTFYEQFNGDTREYIEYIPGNLPIIISAPHGGVKLSGQTIGGTFYPDNDSTLPDRSCGTNERDDNTDILIREIQAEIFALTGCYAHVIINNLHRSKLDPNREQNEATCGDSDALDHWNAWHSFIDQASASVEANWGKGLYIDLHGQSHTIPRIEIGYNITATQLNTGNLNSTTNINRSTIKNLVSNNLNSHTHEELIRGVNSLGELFQNQPAVFYNANVNPGCGVTSGYRAVPSNSDYGNTSCDDTRPHSNAYFDGDFYNNRRHGSGNGTGSSGGNVGGGGHIDGIMTEVNRRVRDLGTYNGNVYDTRPQTLVPFAKEYAAVVLDYIDIHYNDFANFSYAANSYDVSDANPSPTISGLTGGTFASTTGLSINSNTGVIDLSASTNGNYVVTYSVGTCMYYQETFAIEITGTLPDTEAPTAPTNLTASNVTQSSLDLNWTAATDNIGVTAYEIYQDNNLIATVSITSHQVSGLTDNTNYAFYVIAKDAANNSSAASNTINVTTLELDTQAPTTPLNLLASNTTTTTVDLDWEASTDNIATVGYDIYQGASLIAQDVLATTYQATGLSPETFYSFKVIAKDGANNTSMDSNEVGVLTLSGPAQTYCDSQSNNVNDEFISRVQLNTIDNTSDAQFYSDFTAMSTILRKGTQYTITVTPTWTGTIYNEAYAVWIDFNNDGDFEDSGEEVFTINPNQNTSVSGNFIIPSSATETDTRMRVSMKYNGVPTSCEDFTWGEVEDYSIKLVGSNDLIYTNNTWIPYSPSPTTGTDNAIVLDGTYSISDDIQINDIRVEGGANVFVEKSKSLTVNGNLISNDNVTLDSDSNEYASLIVANLVVGKVMYRRYVNTTASVGGNDLVAPPVFGESFFDFRMSNANIVSNTGNTLFLFGPFDKITDTYLLYSDVETAPMYAGTGYRAASTDASTFTFTGLVNTRDVSVPIVNDGPTNPEWNLVGNPYPSYIRLFDFLAANNSQFDFESAGIYGYDGNASDGWTIWNMAYSEANPNAIITPGQGFLVASATNNGRIDFTSTMRITGNTDDFIPGRNSNIAHLQLELNSTSGGRYKTDFYFTDNASNGMDFNYDSSIYGEQAPSSFALYSHLLEESTGIDMAIQSLGFDALENAVIPLGVHVGQGQQFTISISESTIPSNVEVYIEDTQSNTFTLLNTTNYTITPTENLTSIGRYFLHFNEATLGVNTPNENDLEMYTTTRPKELIVKGLLLMDSKLTIYDLQGRLIEKVSLSNSQTMHTIDISTMSSGVYVVHLSSDIQSKTQKVIIK